MPYPHNFAEHRAQSLFDISTIVLMVCLCKQRILPLVDFLFVRERGVLYSYSSHRKSKSYRLRIISSFPPFLQETSVTLND